MNESPTDKLIRELREENARLMDQLKKGGVVIVQGESQGPQEPGGPSEEGSCWPFLYTNYCKIIFHSFVNASETNKSL